jgi:hypothetical protein
MKRRPITIEHVIRRAPRLQAACDRAIDAVLGKSERRRRAPTRNLTAEVEQQFREAKHGST